MLAGYITSDKSYFATVSHKRGQIALINKKEYSNKSAESLEELLNRYIQSHTCQRDFACLAVAGLVYDNSVSEKYLPWRVDADAIADIFGFSEVRIVNEHIATAQGIFELPQERLFTINEGSRVHTGNRGVIIVDEQLGEAMIVYDGERFSTYVTSAALAGFAPDNQLEAELWEYLYSEHDVVNVGEIISRHGLTHILEFLITSRNLEYPQWHSETADCPTRIIELALSAKDDLAVETLDIFIDCLASEAANLATRGMTIGGIYLGGSIPTEIMTALDRGRFMERFVRKNELQKQLAAMPVQVILEPQTPLFGAAHITTNLESE